MKPSGSCPAAWIAMTSRSSGSGSSRRALRLDVQRQAAQRTPALEFDDAITLADGVALRQRQSSGFRKQQAKRERQERHRCAVTARDRHELGVSEIGPRRRHGQEAIDVASRGGCLSHVGQTFQSQAAPRTPEESPWWCFRTAS
jgi:hypothetical protein